MSDMADVLREHIQSPRNQRCSCGNWRPDFKKVDLDYIQHCEHVAAAILAAGFGPVQAARAEAFDYGWREGKGIPTPSDPFTGELFHDQAYRPSFNPYRTEASS
jgi:hypothetical protein